MIIRDKTLWVFDIEVFVNVFHLTIKNTETEKIVMFEISERKNDIIDIIKFFKRIPQQRGWENDYKLHKKFHTDTYFVGYNNHHYDNPIINYIIEYGTILINSPYTRICNSIKNLSDIIINEKNQDMWKHWKYMQYFESIDLLTMLFSSKLRTGLKEMEVTMNFNNVQEFNGDFNDFLPINKIDEMIAYNLNDVNATIELLNRCKEQLDLRIWIEDTYNISCLSRDDVNIGMEILKQKYLQSTHLKWEDIKDLRSPKATIKLNDIILPFIKFDTPILKKVLEEMKEQTVSAGRRAYNNKFIYDHCKYSVGVGGIHTQNNPETIKPKVDEYLIDVDVESLYPSLLISYNFCPPHLNNVFVKIYSNIKKERIEAKHNGEKLKNITFKYCLNGLSGNLQNENSWVYSPETVMKIRINGQLLLLMLVEKLVNVGIKIVQANTDGLFVIVKKSTYELFKQKCNEWEKLTQLNLEEDKYEAMYQFAINDYIAVSEGFTESRDKKLIKLKGMFINKTKLGKGMEYLIIKDAVIDYLVFGTPIEQTIKSCKDIRRFLTYQKVNKKFSVEYNNELVQRINRFYASTDGAYLKRCEIVNGRRTNYETIVCASGVTLLNKLPTEMPKNINFAYYISEARKIIEKIQPRQLSLW
jgi:hypothetical protein